MFKRKIIVGIAACSIMLTGCVSEQSYVGSEKPVANRSFDNIEAARTRISLGLNYLRRGDSSQAKYNLERARSFAPNSAEVYSALAYYYENVGETDQAEEHYLIAINKDPNYADAYNNYGAFLCQLQKYEAAERLLLQAINRPGYIRVAESYENLALCQLQQNNFSKSKSYLNSSINHNSTRISSLVLTASLSYAMGEMTEAKNQLARIQRLGRVSARTVLLSYLIAEKTGDVTTKNNAEQLLLTLYMGSAETTLLLQDKLALSEFELLRERYKETLMSNIRIPTQVTTSVAISKPVANPKLKVVKRKTTEASEPRLTETSATENQAAEQAADTSVANTNETNTVMTPEPSATPIFKNATNDIANSLVLSVQEEAEQTATKVSEPSVKKTTESTITLAAPPLTSLPEETVLTETQAEDTQLEQQTVLVADTKLAEANITETQAEVPQLEQQAVLVADTQLAKVNITENQAAELIDTAIAIQDEPEIKFHLVQADDSLYAISVKYNIRLQRLMEWNQLTPESAIHTGQKVWLQQVEDTELNAQPKPKIASRLQASTTEPYHKVEAGETMFSISYRYNIKLDKFMNWNNLTEQSKLYVGQQLLVVDPALTTHEN